MPRIKQVGNVTAEQIDEGQLHRINFDPNKAIAQEPHHTGEDLVDALQHQNSVITPEFALAMSRVSKHEVFPDKMIEERRSAHGVSFGRLIGYKPTKGRPGHILSVAMKPFGHAEKAVDELYGYQILEKLDVETYKPIGVFPSKDFGNYIVLTEKRNDLMSLDRDSWVEGRRVRNDADVEIAERNTKTVKEIAELLAWLHINGVYHPDGQIKNFAVTDYGKVGVIDPENLTARELGHSDTPALQTDDFEKLIRSLVESNQNIDDGHTGQDKIFGIGMLAGMAEDQVRKCISELITEPYRAALEKYVYESGASIEQAEMLDTAAEQFINMQPEWTATKNHKVA